MSRHPTPAQRAQAAIARECFETRHAAAMRRLAIATSATIPVAALKAYQAAWLGHADTTAAAVRAKLSGATPDHTAAHAAALDASQTTWLSYAAALDAHKAREAGLRPSHPTTPGATA